MLEVARHAEATGWDGVYVADHFMGDGGGFGAVDDAHPRGHRRARPRWPRPPSGCASAPLVLGNTYRHPAVLANWAATVDHVSGGRLLLGVGAGWQENEHEQYGIELPPPGERIDRFEEACQVIEGPAAGAAHHLRAATHYQLTDAHLRAQARAAPLPLLIGGKGDRMLGVVARHADEWNMWGLADAIAERSAVLDRRCEAIGRDPAEITRSAQALVLLTDDAGQGRRLPGGHRRPRPRSPAPPTTSPRRSPRWQDVGLDEVIVPDFTLGRGAGRLERLDALIEQVARSFR